MIRGIRMSGKKLIFCAYAENSKMESGANIGHVSNRTDIYWKNSVVALYSAKKQHSECDVALVTNTDVPEQYKNLFIDAGIKIFREPFDEFVFGENIVWGLAFYKLCAMKKMLEKNYSYYLMMDTDVYVQSRFDDLFTEMEYNIMLHDRHPRLSNKIEIANNLECERYTKSKRPITKWGGGDFGR